MGSLVCSWLKLAEDPSSSEAAAGPSGPRHNNKAATLDEFHFLKVCGNHGERIIVSDDGCPFLWVKEFAKQKFDSEKLSGILLSNNGKPPSWLESLTQVCLLLPFAGGKPDVMQLLTHRPLTGPSRTAAHLRALCPASPPKLLAAQLRHSKDPACGVWDCFVHRPSIQPHKYAHPNFARAMRTRSQQLAAAWPPTSRSSTACWRRV